MHQCEVAQNLTFKINSLLINLLPVKPIRFSSELDIYSLVNAFARGQHFGLGNQNFVVNLIGLNGIDVVPWSTIESELMGKYQRFKIAFENTVIEFYKNGQPVSDLDCSTSLIRPDSPTLFNVFWFVEFVAQSIYPDKPICPFIFKNANLTGIAISKHIDAILIRNLWVFQAIKNHESVINSNIEILTVRGYGFTLDTSLISPLVFEKIQCLAIYISIGAIQADLFKDFSFLETVYLELNNLKNFFHKIGIGWTQGLNLGNYPDVIFKTRGNYWIEESEYSYPDADFCLFAQYPQDPRLAYVLNTLNLTECTHTILWLISNYFKYDLSTVYHDYPYQEQVVQMCRNYSNTNIPLLLDPLINRCQLTKDNGGSTIYAEPYQVAFISEFVQDIVIFVTIPCACALGLLLNILIIRAVHQNKEKELKDDFYKFMSLNAVFNCIYCGIFLFYPINSCIDTLTDGLFCSSIRTFTVTQLYKIVFVAYFGETIKMCANIFFILMNVNRYMLIGREHNSTLQKISKWDFKWVIRVSIVVSALINIGHIFQYEVNKGVINYITSYPLYISLYTTYPIINTFSASSAFYIYLFAYFLTNYLLFFIVNTGVEVTLVRKLHSELADKKKRLDDMNQKSDPNADTPPTAVAAPVLSFRKRRKKEMEDRTEQRAIIMVVFNALINFFFRLPELIFMFTLISMKFSQGVMFLVHLLTLLQVSVYSRPI
jgi:hypothetical protein